MSEVRRRPRRGSRLAISLGIVVFLVSGFIVYLLWPRSSSAVVGMRGGEAWNADRTVAVRVMPGGVRQDTRITFKQPEFTPKEAPIMAALDVIVPAVDIVPDHPLNIATAAEQEAAAYAENAQLFSKVRVKFKVPKEVPLSATDKDGKPQRSIYNAGIEVFNEHLQTWLPLETTIEGDTLVADAPHFSQFRAVWEKAGEIAIGAGKSARATFDAATSHPVDLIGRVAGEYLRSFANNYAGIFDENKMEACKEPDKDYSADVTANDQSKAGACVIGQEGKVSLLMKNGWAFPLMYTTDAPQGVWADMYPAELDLPSLVRNKLIDLFGRNVALASGLDVGKFRIAEGAPDDFTVEGRFSAAGFVVDIALATFTVFMPEGYALAAQTGAVLDTVNCYLVSGQKLYNARLGDIPGRLAEMTKACITPGLVERYGVIELMKAFAKETRILPEITQAFTAGAFGAITGDSLAKVTIHVTKPAGQLKWLVGAWQYQGTGSNIQVKIGDDLKGIWGEGEWDSQENTWQYTVKFHLGMDAGQPTMFVDESNHVVVPKGTRFHIHKKSDTYIIVGDQGNFEFYR